MFGKAPRTCASQATHIPSLDKMALKTGQRPLIQQRMIARVTPVTHEYYDQWARCPRLGASLYDPQGQSTSDLREPSVSDFRSKSAYDSRGHSPFHKYTQRGLPRGDLKTPSPSSLRSELKTAICRSATPSNSGSLELPPLSALKRAATVLGSERIIPTTSPKKESPPNPTLPMRKAVFLFKGETFIQNPPYLPDPYKNNKYPVCTTPNQRNVQPPKSCPGRVTLKTETLAKPGSCGSVQVAKVQFMDFTEIKTYVTTKREVNKPEQPSEKRFVPFSVPLKLNITQQTSDTIHPS